MSDSRWVGVAGLLLVVLLILSFVVISSGGGLGAPEADRSDATILEWYTDSGNQVRVLVAAMIGGLAVIAFLVFLVGLHGMLQEAGAPEALVELSYVGGLVLAPLGVCRARSDPRSPRRSRSATRSSSTPTRRAWCS